MKTILTEPCHVPPLGNVQSRIVMAAMTRGFCGPGHTATKEMAEYYGVRAANGVGLILTEGTIIHASGDGYNNVPHIETVEQAESWKKVTDRVHSEGGKIFCQLWHCGRISHEDYTGGVPPLSSTDQAAEGTNRQNNKPFGTPRSMEKEDFDAVKQQFKIAAGNAIHAGFDGVQLHFGHGYLFDQFFDARINRREDEHGGTVQNRCRFALDVAGEVLSEVGADRVMIRLSPSREMNGLYEWPDMDEMLRYLLPEFGKIGLRMLDMSCANADYFRTSGKVLRSVRNLWPYLLTGGASLSAAQAAQEINDGYLDMVTWGRALIANPDLAAKFDSDMELVEFNRDMLTNLV